MRKMILPLMMLFASPAFAADPASAIVQAGVAGDSAQLSTSGAAATRSNRTCR